MIIIIAFAVTGIFLPQSKTVSSEAESITISYIVPQNGDENRVANPAYSTFCDALSSWEEDHPDVRVAGTTFAPTQYSSQITCQAAIDELPDVFIYPQYDTKAWTDMGLLLDVTDAAEGYNKDDLKPLTRDGKVYGFPVYNVSTALICYDKDVWQDFGYSQFPSTWNELQRALKAYRSYSTSKTEDEDRYLIAMSGSLAPARNVLFTLCGRKINPDWFEGIQAEDESESFIDNNFIDTVDSAGNILTSDIFNDDLTMIDSYAARERFLSGEAPALLGSLEDAEYIIKTLAGTDRYDSLCFAVLPSNDGKSTSISAGFDYALGISSDVDPDKRELLVDLCRTLTGQAYADKAWSRLPIYGTTRPSDTSITSFDAVQTSLYHAVYDAEHTPVYSTCLDSSINDSFATIGKIIDGKRELQSAQEEGRKDRITVLTARDFVYSLQDVYEMNCLEQAGY